MVGHLGDIVMSGAILADAGAWLEGNIGMIGAMVAVGVLLLIVMGFAVGYRKVSQGEALIINGKPFGLRVAFEGAFVFPVLDRVETMDVSVKTIQIARSGHDGLICNDNIRADITVTFFVRVNNTEQDVKQVAQAVGCERASDQDRLEELFTAKFSEALKTVGKQLEFEQLYEERVQFRDNIIEIIGQDLNGYILEDAAIDYLEQTPVGQLDPDNVLDARGLEKITEITAAKRFHRNEFENKAKKDIGLDDLETKKALLEYARREADAEATQRREIAVVEAQQKAQAEEIRSREIARAQKAEIEAQEEVEIRKIESRREQEVATKNRERVLAVEEEAVTRERDLQIVERERETQLKRIEKAREVETEQKAVSEVRRERIAIDKTVAEEEENIETLRRIKGAEREKDASVIAAEGKAEERLIADIKEAQAQEQVATHEAKERVIRADAEVDAAERIARAKKQLAEGVQAEEAAMGLAEVQVKEANAQAIEKEGLVTAKVTREQLLAEAAGKEEGEMVEVRVRQANAEAIEKEGTAEANVIARKGKAEAQALVERKRAEAEGIRERLVGEAEGLVEKAKSLETFGTESLAHEEYRLQLQYGETLGLEKIATAVKIAKAQAEVVGKAMEAADINIVGGNDGFYENFIRSISAGHMIEGFMDTSPTAGGLVNTIIDGVTNATGGGGNLPGGGEGSNGTGVTIDGGGSGMRLTDILSAVRGEADPEGQKRIDKLIKLVRNTSLDPVKDLDGEDAPV